MAEGFKKLVKALNKRRTVILGLLAAAILLSGSGTIAWALGDDRDVDALVVCGAALVLVGVALCAFLLGETRRPPRATVDVSASAEAAPPTAPAEAPAASQQPGDWHVLWPLVLMIAAVVALFLLLTYVFNQFRQRDAFLPENNLPVALITASVALLLSVAVLAIVFKRLDLANKGTALGLPEGSVRAVIALLLIVLFFVTAIFLYADSTRRDTRTLTGITAEQAGALPTGDIARQVPSETLEDRFDVVVFADRPAASQDLAKQLVTTVSTLVVAVSAFYFGANSVQTAVSPRTDKSGAAPDAKNSPAG